MRLTRSYVNTGTMGREYNTLLLTRPHTTPNAVRLELLNDERNVVLTADQVQDLAEEMLAMVGRELSIIPKATIFGDSFKTDR